MNYKRDVYITLIRIHTYIRTIPNQGNVKIGSIDQFFGPALNPDSLIDRIRIYIPKEHVN